MKKKYVEPIAETLVTALISPVAEMSLGGGAGDSGEEPGDWDD